MMAGFFVPGQRLIAQVKPADLQGSWLGVLKVQGIELHLVMNISLNPSDSMIVTFDSPDQGAKDLPTSKVTIREDSLFVSSKKIGGKFSGKVNTGHNSIPGTWRQGGMNFPLTMDRQEKKFTLNRPQEPNPPFPYRSEEVVVRNAEGGFDLAGTLTLPEGGGPFPCAILVTGSGPQNRDEELLGHKPFLVLADYLTRNGIAVLRCDDRGVAKSGGDFKTATTLDFANDVESAPTSSPNAPTLTTAKPASSVTARAGSSPPSWPHATGTWRLSCSWPVQALRASRSCSSSRR